jgi:carbamate kinase
MIESTSTGLDGDRHHHRAAVVSLISYVVVDEKDQAFQSLSPIGPFYTEEQAKAALQWSD